MLSLKKSSAVLAALLFSLPNEGVAAKVKLTKAKHPFAGRWDITVTLPTGDYPDWLEVIDTDGKPEVRLQQRTGSVHPVESAHYADKHLILGISAASTKGPAITWEVYLDGQRMVGVLKRGEMINGQISGVRAPELKRKEPKSWTAPEALFNGKDLTGWLPDNAQKIHWVVKEGAIVNESGGANLMTARKFQDFKLHAEYNCPNLGNSGIYLRGRYEVQVEYEAAGVEDKLHEMGSVYGMLAPSQELPRKPGEWETLDITMVGRYVTIVRNGTTIIDHQEIPGITGGALNANEGEPGPFYLQGDHTGGMKFRNITVSVPEDTGKHFRVKKH
jgi:hypothetical protein